MKPRFFFPQLVVALLALVGMSSGRAATYTFTGATVGGGSFDWSTGTGWNAIPVSDPSTMINLFDGINFTGPGGTAGTYTLDNDIPGVFELNGLLLGGLGNASAGTTNINVTGNTLSFVNDGLIGPTLTLSGINFAGGQLNYTVSNNLHFADDTSIITNLVNNVVPNFNLAGIFSGGGNLNIDAVTANDSQKKLQISGTQNNTRQYEGDIVIDGGAITFNPDGGSSYQFYTAGDLVLNGGSISLQGAGVALSVLSFSGTGGSVVGVNSGHTIVVNDPDPGAKSFSGSVSRDLSLQYLGAGTLTMPTANGGLNSARWRVGGVGTVVTPGIVTGAAVRFLYAQSTLELTGTSGPVMGSVTSDTSVYGGTVRFAPAGSDEDVLVTAWSAGSRIDVSGAATVELDKGSNNSLRVNAGATSATEFLVRGQAGSLVIKPAGGLDTLGLNGGEFFNIVSTNASAVPVVTNGIVLPWMVGQDVDGTKDFLTYSGTGGVGDVGFQRATYSGTTLGGATSTSVIKVTESETVAAATSVYALRNDSTVTINSGQILTVGDDNQGGIILNGGIITGGTLAFGNREAVIHTGATGGEIGSVISGGGVALTNIAGLVSLSKSGEGTLSLTGQNTYTGQTVVNQGALRVSEGSLPSSALLLRGGVLETSGTFNRAIGMMNTSNVVNFGGTNEAGGGFSAFGGALSVNLGNIGETLAWSSANFLADYALFVFGSSTSNSVVDFQNGLELGTNSAAYFRQIDVKDNVNSSDDVALISGLIADTSGSEGLHGLQKTGDGTLVLGANNTYTGITAISSGTLQLGYVGTVNSQSYDGSTGTVAGDVHNYGTLAFQRSNAHTFAGEISGTGDVVHNGSGTTALTAANTYGGGTVMNAGTLLVNNSEGSGLGSGNVTVDGGTLGGSGGFTGDVLVNAGGTLSPGNSIESLGTGSIAFDGGTFEFELNTTTVAADLVYGGAGSTLTLSGGAMLSLSDLGSGDALALGTKFTLISYDGAWNNGTFTGYADDSIFSFANNTWQIDYNDTSAGLNFTSEANLNGSSFVTMTVVVPEPTTSLLLGLGLATALFGFRRRR